MIKKISVIFLALILMLSMAACGGGGSKEPTQDELYEQAVSLAESGDYAGAVAIFRDLGDFNDSQQLKKENAFLAVSKYLKENGSDLSVPFINQSMKLNSGIEADATDAGGNAIKLYAGLDNKDQLVLGSYKHTPTSAGQYTGTLMLPLTADMTNAKIGCFAYMEISPAYTLESGSKEVDIATFDPTAPLEFDSVDYELLDMNGNSDKKSVSWSEATLVNNYVNDTVSVFFDEIYTLLQDSGAELNDMGFANVPLKGSYGSAAESEADADADAAAEEKASSSSGSESATLELDTGKIVYTGWSYAPEGFVGDGAKDSEILLLNFEYTNLEDTDKMMESDFVVDAYQNGVEITNQNVSYHPGVAEGVDNFWKSVLKDGKINVSTYYKLEDNSPVTVIIRKNGGEEKTQFEITLE